ncbi:rolling circle replication-associated protein [Labilibacter marinus]|uniref:rolling circle replication-associated protein n=1 Tax=Labilibacter marinus TaxID=1477105 RepID=UPI00082C8F65|nr:hypothetical protein [Labilibacter marinus]
MDTLQPILLDNGFVKMPALSVSPLRITAYHKMFTPDGRESNPLKGKKPDCINKEKGDLSSKGKKALEKAVYWFLYSVDERILTTGKGKDKISFITLTLPSRQVHSDKVIKSKCLNQFLTELKAKYGVEKYIWKAEKQENGNIHFHILCEQRIPYQEINDIWNRIVGKLGYLFEYAIKMRALSFDEYLGLRNKGKKKVNINQIKKAYERGEACNWRNPNSTDIESLRGVKNIAAYISKYMSKGHKEKDKPELQVIGRIWYSSQSVAKMKNLQLDGTDNLIMDEFVEIVKKSKDKDVFENDYSLTVSAPIQYLKKWGYKLIPDEFMNHCKLIFSKIGGFFRKIYTSDVFEIPCYEDVKKKVKEALQPKQKTLSFIQQSICQ